VTAARSWAWLVLAGLVWSGGCHDLPAEDIAPATVADSARRRAFWETYRLASESRAAGRLEEAVRLYTRALALQPDHEDSLYYLGNSQLERRAFPEALEAYRRLVALNPSGSSRGYMQIASIRASLEPAAPVDLDEAAALFQRALDVDPDSGALLGLAEVAVIQHRYVEAERMLARVDADNPMSIAAPYLRGYLASERRSPAEAWALFKTAVARGELKKGGVTWTEEGDVKGTPELRWRALARQSVFGPHWIRLRAYMAPPGPTRADMQREYDRLRHALGRGAR